MALEWLGNPKVWEKSYRDQDTRSLKNFGLENVKEIKLVSVEKPEELKAIEDKVNAFWNEYSAAKPNSYNGTFHGITGFNALNIDTANNGDVITISTYEADYATLMFKLNELNQETKGVLNPKEKEFLRYRFHLLGIGGYVENSAHELLLGQAKHPIKDKLWEYVPQGSVNHEENFLDDQLEKELKEEAGLTADNYYSFTHLNISPDWSNFTLIAGIKVGHQEATCSDEHYQLVWKKPADILLNNRYEVTPVTYRLVEHLTGAR